jgi:hypothetical protein
VAFSLGALDFEGLELNLVFPFAGWLLAPAKALRSDASMPTKRHSSRLPQAAGSAAATTEPPRGTAVATESRQEVAVAAVVTTAATTASTVPSVPAHAAGDRAAAVEIPDNDAPPLGWGQWENWPAPAPEPAAGVLVMREDGCVMSWHPTHGAEPSSSRAALPAPDGTVARPEQEQELASVPPTHFNEAQAEQALWQEFRDHDASLNNTLNEALRIHVGPAWRISRYAFSVEIWSSFPPHLFRARVSPDSVSLLPSLLVTGVGGSSLGDVRPPRPAEVRA